MYIMTVLTIDSYCLYCILCNINCFRNRYNKEFKVYIYVVRPRTLLLLLRGILLSITYKDAYVYVEFAVVNTIFINPAFRIGMWEKNFQQFPYFYNRLKNKAKILE